jgi:hypothetical protein
MPLIYHYYLRDPNFIADEAHQTSDWIVCVMPALTTARLAPVPGRSQDETAHHQAPHCQGVAET